LTFLEQFTRADQTVDGVRIATWVAGSGPPVLLLHGYPQTHVMWHAVAPALAADHTVVLTDLRGYGDSDKPPAGADHVGYAKRTMAADQVGVMAALGFDRFALVGHDRGARVAHRLALDHPGRVERVAVLDIAPTHHMVTTTDLRMARAYFHWFFLAQAPDLPERMIGADPAGWLRNQFARVHPGSRPLHPDAVAAYEAAFSDPAAIAASCEDYRAALTVDLADDEADRDRRVVCPLLVIWGEHGFIGARYQPVEVWRQYADNVEGTSVPTSHFVAEEDPEGTVSLLSGWLAGDAQHTP
jgi:haloacetate dehalogenase